MANTALGDMGRYLKEMLNLLEDGQRELAVELETGSLSRSSCPGPLQGDGQNVANICHLVQELMCEDTEDGDKQSHKLQNVGQNGHMALLGHCLTAYLSMLNKDGFRKLTTRILSDTTLWLCRLFRYENSSAFFHEDDREGLVRVCRLVLHTLYEDYASEGYAAFSSAQPIIYQSTSSREGLGQHICNQLGLALSSLCTVPCNTVFGSQHQMDVALLEKLIKEDLDAGKLPLLLIANAGNSSVDRAYRLGRLKELCVKYSMWLHVEGVSLATLALDDMSSSVKRAVHCDSMTLTLGPWLGLPAVPAVTLYRHEDPALSLAAGLTASQPGEKLRPLALWLSLQLLGNEGIVQKIRHATDLSKQLMERLKTVPSIITSDVLDTEISLREALTMVENDVSSPEVLFRFSPETSSGAYNDLVEGCSTEDRDIMDTFNRWLGERLARLVPVGGVDVVELEDDGTCVRFNPLMTAAGLGTQASDVEVLVEKLLELVPVLSSTLRLRDEFRREVQRHSPFLSLMEDLAWPGLGALRYNPQWFADVLEDKQLQEVEKMNCELMKKLQEQETSILFSSGTLTCSILFSSGPEYGTARDRIFVGMVTEDLVNEDISHLVNTVAALGREIEENGKLFENMAEVVQRGILEAQLQLQKDSEKRILEEGVLRQLPVVSSVLNWFSPWEASVNGRTFNLTDGLLDSTEPTYSSKAQTSALHLPDTPTTLSSRLQGKGRKLFLHSEDAGTVTNPGRDSADTAADEAGVSSMPPAALNTNPFSPSSPGPPSVDADQRPESHAGPVVQQDDSLTSKEGRLDPTAR
ncbi:pyridoxal-dependent decarboxylase domain-containing protein 1 isoform X2 [Gadus chalcogrammus]|uniref:pyridoxal-dependent decarboxylase domain-containing protein 1 isoform X2 n=1 Tax=Gadus chalcogrammus TaxID=1042646 RepID=UPI0024C28A2C|nr:pyridoxal-dependent decarboxylase domain-containing protein 1 isoform X2 [Gadus chalcogrammus]